MLSRISLQVWSMWLLGSIFYAYQYILRVLPNIIMPDLMAKFDIDAATFGQFSGVYYLGYAAMHIPIGLMLDRIGPRKVMTVSILCTIIGVLPMVYADLWIYPILGRVLIGMGSSGAILGVFKIIRMGFPEAYFTRMLGVSVTIGLLGAIYGGQPVHYLLHTWGWEITLKMICIMGLILAVGTYIALPSTSFQTNEDSNIWQDLKSLCTHGRIFLICILGGLMVGPLEGFADAWGTSFLTIAYDIDPNLAATLPSFVFLGMCFGAPVIGYLAQKLGSYFATIFLCAVFMGIGFIWILTGTLSITAISILFSIIGVFCAYQIIVIYKASTYVPERMVAVTNATANMIIMTFGYFFHGSIGGLMRIFWQGEMVDGSPWYSASVYATSLSLIPASLALAAIGFAVFWYMERKEIASKAFA